MPVQSKRSHKMRHVTRQVTGAPWQVLPEKLEQVCEVLNMRASGLEWTEAEVRTRLAANGVLVDEMQAKQGDTPAYTLVTGGVAVIQLEGLLGPKMNLFMFYSGGTSTQQFSQAVRQAADDPKVSAIVLEVDSPGGYAMGNEEAALAIREAAQKKPIVTVANGDMASAAYYIGVATGPGNVFASPSSWAGSIGTIYVHAEHSKADAEAGTTYTVVRAGKNKWASNQYEPLTDKGKDNLQEEVDQADGQFVQAVATSRGISPEMVMANFGQGKYFIAEEAEKHGLIDGVMTLETVIAELKGGRRSPAKRSAQNRVSTKEKSMDARIMTALRDRELIDGNADKAAAQVALNVWYKAQDKDVPESVEKILADLVIPEPVSYSQEQLDAAVAAAKAEAAEQAVETPEPPEEPAAYTQAQLDAAVSEAETKATTAATKAERSRAAEIVAKVQLSKLEKPMDLARELIDEGCSMGRTTERLFTLKCEQTSPVGETASTDLGNAKSFDDKAKEEFKKAGGQNALGVTEEAYVRSARIDAGLESL